MNVKRAILGGLLAGVVINIWEALLNGKILGPAWATWAQGLGSGAHMPSNTAGIIGWVCWGFLAGLGCVWGYAAVRPRFGAGPATAIRAGLAVWLIGVGLTSIAEFNLGLPVNLILINLVVAAVLIPPSAILGAWAYKEGSQVGAMGAASGR
jgi:hypothetical protein